MKQSIVPLSLFSKPTPVTIIEGLAPGVKIHVKRDDLTGMLCSGNKVRKLEFLLADAQARNANLVITCGGVQSNHVRATIAACTTLGLKSVGVLRGKPEAVPDGNYMIDFLLGADLKFITVEEYKRVNAIMEDVAQEYRRKGFRPYVIPEGGSNGVGALGYAQCALELADYVAANKVDAIFCAVGSGGTYAGLRAGMYIHGLDTPLYGILVADDVPTFQRIVSGIIREMEGLLNSKLPIAPDQMNLVDGFIGPGYGQVYPEAVEVIKRVAPFGILLEPVYTAKTFHGMLTMLRDHAFKNPLFVHTGGIFGLFPYRQELFPAGKS